MDRDAWIMAASLLDRHGVEAAAVVCARLATLHHLVEFEDQRGRHGDARILAADRAGATDDCRGEAGGAA